MSVPTGEFAAPAQGVAGDGSPAIAPDAGQSWIATAPGVAAPSDQFAEPAAPSEPAGPLIDIDALPEDERNFLVAEYRKRLDPEVQQKIAALQSTKDREVQEARQLSDQYAQQARTAQTQLQQAGQFLSTYIQELAEGKRQPDIRDLALFQLSIQGTAQQATQDAQAAASAFATWKQTQDTQHAATVQKIASGGNGLPPIDPSVIANDPTTRQYLNEIEQLAVAEMRDGFRQRYAPQGQAKWNELQQHMFNLAQRARLQLVAQPQAATNQLVQQNLARQAERGVQTPAVVGSTAGAPVGQGLWDQVASEVKSRNPQASYEDIYQAWLPRSKTPQPQQPTLRR